VGIGTKEIGGEVEITVSVILLAYIVLDIEHGA
jgi:hypothetical protein